MTRRFKIVRRVEDFEYTIVEAKNHYLALRNYYNDVYREHEWKTEEIGETFCVAVDEIVEGEKLVRHAVGVNGKFLN